MRPDATAQPTIGLNARISSRGSGAELPRCSAILGMQRTDGSDASMSACASRSRGRRGVASMQTAPRTTLRQ
eukprot:7382607-Prymnesium_polylepis.1